MGGGDDMAVPKTKSDIVSLCLDRCALDHAGFCSAHLPGCCKRPSATKLVTVT